MCEVRRRLREAWASAGTSRVKGDAHTGLMSAEPVTAVDVPDDGDGQCWCCGTVERPDRMVHLGNHPEVHLCLRCAHFVHQQAGQIEDEVRGGPGAWAREGCETSVPRSPAGVAPEPVRRRPAALAGKVPALGRLDMEIAGHPDGNQRESAPGGTRPQAATRRMQIMGVTSSLQSEAADVISRFETPTPWCRFRTWRPETFFPCCLRHRVSLFRSWAALARISPLEAR